MCELSTDKCLCTTKMNIIEYNKGNKLILNKNKYFILLAFLTKNTSSIHNISFEFKQNYVSFLCKFYNVTVFSGCIFINLLMIWIILVVN